MTGWRALPGVGGGPSGLGPYEGTPAHLWVPLWEWFEAAFGRGYYFRKEAALLLVARLELDLAAADPASQRHELLFYRSVGMESDRLLQAIHYQTYEYTTKAQVEEVIRPNDAASVELREAWQNAYGFNPDPSDCWDHCIKALEALLKPLILPNYSGATLGKVVGEVSANRTGHGLVLRDNGLNNLTNPHDTLVGLLRLVWSNPDRHQGAHHRVPTIDEARGVLATTVTVAQWTREGLIH